MTNQVIQISEAKRAKWLHSRGRVPEGMICAWIHECGCMEFHLTPDGPWCLRCERVVEGWL